MYNKTYCRSRTFCNQKCDWMHSFDQQNAKSSAIHSAQQCHVVMLEML